MTTNLKTYGLQRSGTNYLIRLVEQNFADVRVWHHHPGWRKDGDPGDKHGPLIELPDMDGYLLVSKGPYAWIDSMQRYQPGRVSDLVGRWNQWAENAVRFAFAVEPMRVVMRYREELLVNLASTLDWIGQRFCLDRATPTIEDEPKELRRGGDAVRGGESVTRSDFTRRAYYLERQYLDAMPGQMRARIDELVDWDMAGTIGYRREDFQ